jgi:histone-lysine N-methyltransferase SETMAR
MNKEELRVIMRYCWLRKLNGVQMANEINDTYGEDTINVRTCQRWICKFNGGETGVTDGERSGRPSLNIDDDIKDYLQGTPRATSCEIAQFLNVSDSTVREHMMKIGLKYVSCRWVPHELSEGNKQCRIRICNELLLKFQADNFLHRLITIDETWIYWKNAGTFSQKQCWAGGDIRRVTNVSRSLTPDKTMLVIFWDARGVICWDLLPQGQTINSDIYCSFLDELKIAILQKRRRSLEMPNHGFHLLQDNARPHTARNTIQKLNDINLPTIPHPPYSPDLAPSDYYLFSPLKHSLKGKAFTNREQVSNAINDFIEQKKPEFFANGINMLPERWRKCVEADGAYF